MFTDPVADPVYQFPPSNVPVSVITCQLFPSMLMYPVLYTASSLTENVNDFEVSVLANVIVLGALNVDTGVLNNGDSGLAAIPNRSVGSPGLDGSVEICVSSLIVINENTIAGIRTIIQYLSLTGK
jgi:hypothetical protein